MRRNQPKHNNVTFYRRRMGFQQRQVARLLGHRDGSVLSLYESGQTIPRLIDAFKLSIILRVPVEFLFPAIYDALRSEIRAKEESGGNSGASSLTVRPHDHS